MKVKQFNTNGSITCSGTIHVGIEQYHTKPLIAPLTTIENNSNFYVTVNNKQYYLNQYDILEFQDTVTSMTMTISAKDWNPYTFVTVAYDI